jgi:CheY-like chemotaxis protein
MITGKRSPVILLADDDADDRLLVQEALSEAGVSSDLHFVQDGEDLLAYLKTSGSAGSPKPRPELILLDLNMPLKDGREVLRDIRADQSLRRIPVVVFTTSKADTDIRQMYELGANSFITKPTGFTDLVVLMKQIADYWFDTVHIPDAEPQAL